MNPGKTAVRWLDPTLDSGKTRTAVLRGNISASTSTVSPPRGNSSCEKVLELLKNTSSSGSDKFFQSIYQVGHLFIFKSYFLLRSSANPGPQCDLASGWSPYGSNCYKLKAKTMKSWSQARRDCVQEGGDLVSITSAAEEQYVTGILGTSRLDIWIGFSTLVRGTQRGVKNLTFLFNI